MLLCRSQSQSKSKSLVLVLALCWVWFLGALAQGEAEAPLTVQYRVWEEQPAGIAVGRLSDDLRQRGIEGLLEDFQVVEQGWALPFTVSARDGGVRTRGRLDREELCRGAAERCEIAFSALYRKQQGRAGPGTGARVGFLHVRVEVADLNDHSPTFSSDRQEVEISESAAVRMRVPLDRAVDPDAGAHGLQTYSLSPNTHFALDVRPTGAGSAQQPELVLVKELDREAQAFFELTLTAWDKGNPPRSGSTLVKVTVLDSNDNSPAFEDGALSVELAEDSVQGTTVAALRASDPDQGANGQVEYSLSRHAPADVQQLFAIDPQTGVVTLRGQLDFEERPTYEVDVQARDLGPNAVPSHAKLSVRLRDVNDNPPCIHVTWTLPDSTMATVSEAAPNGMFLALVMVSDADSGANGEVQVQLERGAGCFHLERVHGDTYMIVTSGGLDREATAEHNLTVLARDRGHPPLSAMRHLMVRVLDENDNAPAFSKTLYRAVFHENNPPGFRVLTVEARDADLGPSGSLTFAIRKSNELGMPTAAFSVHPTSGVVTVATALDYEESRSYSFVVEAVDCGHPPLTGSATVLIQLEDTNDNHPVITQPTVAGGVAAVNVPVDAERGEIVTELGDTDDGVVADNGIAADNEVRMTNGSAHGRAEGFLATTVRATDADSGANGRLSFQLASEGHASGLFRLCRVSGRLYINSSNATELIGRTFRLGMAVSDAGLPSPLTTHVTLEVTFISLRDHLRKNALLPATPALSLPVLLAACLGTGALLLLLAVALATSFCRPEKRDGRRHAYNCRQAESTYGRHPRRPQKHIGKQDIQLVPALRGRRDDTAEGVDLEEARPLALHTPPLLPPPMPQEGGQFILAPVQTSTLRCHLQMCPLESDATLPRVNTHTHTRTLRKPGSIELDAGALMPRTPNTPNRTLRKNNARNPSSSSSNCHSNTNTLGRHGNHVEGASPGQATLRRQRNGESRGVTEQAEEPGHQQILRSLVRLSLALGENRLQLASASPHVQQVSELLSLLHQGQFQPRPNFRGNKYSHRAGRSGAADADWLSTKDSGHGESEAGDMDWEAGRDSPIDPLLQDSLQHLLNNADDVFSDVPDPAWMARLSLPLAGDYHENLFVPEGSPSPDGPHPSPGGGLDDSASFSTFGKMPEKPRPLDGALLSEVSTLFDWLLTQKADAQPRTSAEVLYRLSAAYRRSLGLDTPLHAAQGPIRSEHASPSVHCSVADPRK